MAENKEQEQKQEQKQGTSSKVITNELDNISVPSEQVSIDDLLQDAEGVQLQFDKIKIPTAGGVAYTVMDFESGEEEPMKKLKGVVLKARPSNIYFEEDYNGEAVPPTCYSDNGNIGTDNDGVQHDCKTCQFNQFGSANNGKGKACQNRTNLYIVLDGETVPRLMSLPASALAKFNSLRTQLFVTRRLLSSVVIEIGLEKKKSATGIDYSSPTFSIVGPVSAISAEQQANIRNAASLLKVADVL